jgi:putative tricarboxylic transport membrane protein
MKIGDIVSGAVLAGLGIFIILEARAWDYLGADGPGPGFFPLWYGMLMVALALILVVSSVRKSGAVTGPALNWREIGRALSAWLALAICVGLLKVLGFLLAFGLFTFFLVYVMYRRPLMPAIAVAVGVCLGFYLVFPLALDVGLPIGRFGF